MDSSSLNFRSPIDPITVNGFPVEFKRKEVKGFMPLYVPVGIFRDTFHRSWSISVSGAEARLSDHVADRGRSPEESLYEAWESMKSLMNQSKSKFSDDQPVSTGPKRDPSIDTKVTGVNLSKSTSYNRRKTTGFRCLVTTIRYKTKKEGEAPKDEAVAMINLSESNYLKDPENAIKRFYERLEEAVAIRRYYNHLRTAGEYPKERISYEDIPDEIKNRPYDSSHLDPVALLHSFSIDPLGFFPATSGCDSEALRKELLEFSGEYKHETVYLNGFILRFREVHNAGATLYLPTGIHRIRHGWRVFLRHSDGILSKRFYDKDCGSNDDTFKVAWQFYLDGCLSLTAPSSKLPPVMMQITFTGIEGLVFMLKKNTNPFGCALRYFPRANDDRKRSISVGWWRENTLTDESLKQALRHGTAIHNYQNFCHPFGLESFSDLVTDPDMIPDRFWPKEPVINIYADDFLFLSETWKS